MRITVGWLGAMAIAQSAASSPAACAATFDAARQSVVTHYYDAARQLSKGDDAPSARRGAAFFAAEHERGDGATMSCATCHTSDPRQTGKTRAHKPILPLAPAVNAQRLTDQAHVEKWFERNCRDVLGRPCTPVEKADFIAYLLSVEP